MQILKLKMYAAALAMTLPLVLQGCSEGQSSDVTVQGSVPLEKIIVGIPESTLKESILTFVPDTSANAGAGGKTQYLSREKNANGGQYIVQCKDGTVFQVSTLFTGAPISKETAEAELKKLLPKDAQAQSKVEEQAGKQIYYYGDNYIGEVILTPATKGAAPLVSQVSITSNPTGVKAATADAKEKSQPGSDKATKNQ